MARIYQKILKTNNNHLSIDLFILLIIKLPEYYQKNTVTIAVIPNIGFFRKRRHYEFLNWISEGQNWVWAIEISVTSEIDSMQLKLYDTAGF